MSNASEIPVCERCGYRHLSRAACMSPCGCAFPAICYHRNRRSTVDLFSTTAVTTLRCLDCGATVSAGYRAPLPDLPPMPYPAAAPAARVGGVGDTP